MCSLLLILFVSLFTRARIICSLLRDYFGNILDRKNFSSRARCCRISILERFIMFLPQCAGTLSTLGRQVAQLRFERNPSVRKLFFNMLDERNYSRQCYNARSNLLLIICLLYESAHTTAFVSLYTHESLSNLSFGRGLGGQCLLP